MLSSNQLAQLIDPVIFRAQADAHIHASGFVDRTAHYLLRHLGINSDRIKMANHWGERKSELTRCLWVDRQATQFFQQHPKGLGVEINAGLSTRFHRLSENLDWPQFYWQAINEYEVAACIANVFVSLDNHSNTACQDVLSSWHKQVDWPEQTAILIILDDRQPITTWQDFQTFCCPLFKYLNEQAPTINLLLSHRIPNLKTTIAASGLKLSVLSSYNQKPIENSLFSKLLAAISTRRKQGDYTRAEHIVLYR